MDWDVIFELDHFRGSDGQRQFVARFYLDGFDETVLRELCEWLEERNHEPRAYRATPSSDIFMMWAYPRSEKEAVEFRLRWA